jgi:hypothetical protein
VLGDREVRASRAVCERPHIACDRSAFPGDGGNRNVAKVAAIAISRSVLRPASRMISAAARAALSRSAADIAPEDRERIVSLGLGFHLFFLADIAYYYGVLRQAMAEMEASHRDRIALYTRTIRRFLPGKVLSGAAGSVKGRTQIGWVGPKAATCGWTFVGTAMTSVG